MKIFNRKLNNKGFTLIELLAVIVILALVMVVTIPTVLKTMGDARKNTLKNSANAIAEWADKQNALVPLSQHDTAYKSLCGSQVNVCTASNFNSTNGKNFIKAAGGSIDGLNLSSSKLTFVNGRACVTLVSNGTGPYSNLTGTDATQKSNGC